VWRGTECVAVLEGHEGPVLSLAVTPGGDILSGSGDTTVRRWSGGKCVQTYRGHTDTVRALCVLPGVGFVSGSHDQSLRVWTVEGEVLAELYGHSALIYTVAASADGLIVSGGRAGRRVFSALEAAGGLVPWGRRIQVMGVRQWQAEGPLDCLGRVSGQSRCAGSAAAKRGGVAPLSPPPSPDSALM
jgi:WD40 repeat protein